jgi:hypothetical protein
MTLVVTVSANTAAYAMESMKPVQRVPRKTHVEEAIQELVKKVEKSDDHKLRAILNVVKPPALALYFLTANLQKNPQATIEQVAEAYDENAT